MLALAPSAAEAVRQLVASSPVDDDGGGIRIAAGETTEAGTALTIEIVDGPDESDAEVEESGARVFMEPDVADFLDDKVLDVQVAGGHASFAIRDQTDPDPAADGRPEA